MVETLLVSMLVLFVGLHLRIENRLTTIETKLNKLNGGTSNGKANGSVL